MKGHLAMTQSPRRRASLRAVLGTATVIVLAGALIACTPIPVATGSTPTSSIVSPVATATSQAAWQATISTIPQSGSGCFTVNYPRLAWDPVACTASPPYPQAPGRGLLPAIVGGTNDIGASNSSGLISTAVGSFDHVAGVIGEDGPIGNSGSVVDNAYSLQLNTNRFGYTACMGSPNRNCQLWEQFVFDNAGGTASAYIQYWLVGYNAPCPDSTWNQFSYTGKTDIHCWKNDDDGAVAVPAQPISSLASLRLRGTVTPSGDRLILSTPGTAYLVTGPEVGAKYRWNEVEFNVLGDGGNSNGGGQANFKGDVDIQPHILINGGAAAPTCVPDPVTAETNNLDFALPPPAPGPPGLMFHENAAHSVPVGCAAATTS
jgi:hypothetical protein